MGQPYVGEIRMFAGTFEPLGWMFCDGRPLPISENEVLFQLIGTTYGGDGEETFNLPNLQGRIPIHMGTAPSGTTYQLGEMAGVEEVTLNVSQIPAHSHPMIASLDGANVPNPGGAILGTTNLVEIYSGYASDDSMNPAAITPTGGSQPHTNMQPYLCVNFIISLYGLFPSQT